MDELKRTLSEKNDLKFFGTITASVSHELNNVISIINEYSGLLEDLLQANDQGNSLDREKILKIAQNITEQIKREKKIIKLLNRFAHRVDAPVAEFNLNELLNDIVRLSKRFASLKKVELDISLPEEQINITNNPFAVQHIIFLCLNLSLEFSAALNTISVTLDKEKSRALITIVTSPLEKGKETETKLDYISNTIGSVGGEFICITNNESNQIFKLYLPSSMMVNEEKCSDEHKDIIG